MGGILEESLVAGTGKLGMSLAERDIYLYRKYYQLLKEENSKYNLTSLEGEKEVAVKHFLDSLSCLTVADFRGKKVIDIGAGAGFPGIPLKIHCPEMYLVLVDSVKKKVNFLEMIIRELAITGAEARWDRAEALGRDEEFREGYDIAVSRAVAPLNVLAELCLPLVNRGGCFLSMKGPGAGEELAEAQRSVALLGGRVEKCEKLKLPFYDEERNIILIRKVADTPPQYPRREGMPGKRPIK